MECVELEERPGWREGNLRPPFPRAVARVSRSFVSRARGLLASVARSRPENYETIAAGRGCSFCSGRVSLRAIYSACRAASFFIRSFFLLSFLFFFIIEPHFNLRAFDSKAIVHFSRLREI